MTFSVKFKSNTIENAQNAFFRSHLIQRVLELIRIYVKKNYEFRDLPLDILILGGKPFLLNRNCVAELNETKMIS